jgi:hypothetical protein
LTTIFGFLFVLLLLGLVLFFAFPGRQRFVAKFRDIPAFDKLRQAVGFAVEAGARVHVSTGWGSLTGTESAPAFAGLSVLDRIGRAASVSDRPPVATSGNGAVAILSQDTLRGAFRSLGAEAQFRPSLGRLVGLTPISFAAGTLPVIYDEQVSTNVLLGHFDQEIALISDATQRTGSLAVAGTDSLPGQAVAFASVQEPLIGEEVFASGAYLGAGPVHDASLQAQDVLRWVLIVALIAGSLLKLLGLDQTLLNLIPGGLR